MWKGKRCPEQQLYRYDTIWHTGVLVSLFFSDEETGKGRRTTNRVRKQHQQHKLHHAWVWNQPWKLVGRGCILPPRQDTGAQLDRLNTSSRHGWRRTCGGRSSSLPRPPKATEAKGEGQECWRNSETSCDSGIELPWIFFCFPFKYLEWIEYWKMMKNGLLTHACSGDGVKEPNHGNSAPLLPEVQHGETVVFFFCFNETFASLGCRCHCLELQRYLVQWGDLSREVALISVEWSNMLQRLHDL